MTRNWPTEPMRGARWPNCYGNKARFRRLGRISFRCNEVKGRALLERWIDTIEFHFQQSLDREDFRMIVQIQESGFKIA